MASPDPHSLMAGFPQPQGFPMAAPLKCSLLLVDDETYLLPSLSALLATDYEVLTALSAEAAQQVFAQRQVDIILTDQRMPRTTGAQLLEWVREHSPRTVRLLMTGYAELGAAIEAINRGHVYYYLPKPWRTEELLQVLGDAADRVRLERSREHMVDNLGRLNQELERRVAERTHDLEEANCLLRQRTRELEEAKEQLEKLARTDDLTGVANRRAIEEVAHAEVERHLRFRHPLALGLLDIDHFREFNKRHLHTGGDQVLVALARILGHSVRAVDTVGRIGGDEFLVVAPEADPEGAQALAERIRSTVENTPIRCGDEWVRVTVSVGFAVAEGEVEADHRQMRQVAAAALQEAKARGRNGCAILPVQADPRPA